MFKLAKQRNVKLIQDYTENFLFKKEFFNFILIVYTVKLSDDPLHFLKETLKTLREKSALVLATIDRKSSWGKLAHFHASPEIKNIKEPRKKIGRGDFVALEAQKNNIKVSVLIL